MKKEKLTITIDPDLRRQINQLAIVERRKSVSDMVSILLEDAIKQRESDLPSFLGGAE